MGPRGPLTVVACNPPLTYVLLWYVEPFLTTAGQGLLARKTTSMMDIKDLRSQAGPRVQQQIPTQARGYRTK